MKPTGSILTFFAVTCIVAAGCSGGSSTPSLPYASNAVSSAASGSTMTADASMSSDRSGACRTAHCLATLVVPLEFNGHRFTIGRFASCKSVSLGAAHSYVAPRSKHFWLRNTVSLKPACVPSSATSRLFIGIAEIGARARHGSGAIDVVDAATKTKISFVPLGRMSNFSGKAWQFSPVGFGIKMTAHANYVFYVISAPLTGTTTSPSGNYLLLQPLSFDGTNFTEVSNSCYQDEAEDATPYVAPTSGPLTLSGPVTLTPTCVPSPVPSNAPQLYIVAVDLTNSGGDVKRATTHALRGGLKPADFFLGVPAVAVAGGVNITDNPWVFMPDSPGLAMTGGTSYAFFIAAALPPAPPPTQGFREVVPLNFDGTNFTLPAIASCTTLPSPSPYTAPTSGPLTLTASVSVAPTCAPTTGSGSGSGSGGGDVIGLLHANDGGGYGYGNAQLYIFAVPGGCSSSGSSSSSSSSSGNGCCGSSSSSSSSSGCGSSSSGGGGDVMRRHDEGSSGCNGGDDILKHHPHDGGGYGGGCKLNGFAIAGPVNLTDNPWLFAPIAPALSLTGGTQYTFYIGLSNGHGGGDGGSD